MARRIEASNVAHGTLSLKPVGDSDFQVRVCGMTVGQIMGRKRSFGRVVWFWSLSGPHLPETMAVAGSNAQTLGGAKQAVKRAFDAWLQLATGQHGGMTWEKPSSC